MISKTLSRVTWMLAIVPLMLMLASTFSAGQPFPLPKPVLECPPVGTQFGGIPRSIVLSWQGVPGFNFNEPDNHRYQVVITSYPIPPVLPPAPIILKKSSVPAHLFEFTLEGTYSWAVKVVAYDTVSGATTAQVSPLSNIASFTYVLNGPPAPECGPQVPFTIPPVPIAPDSGSQFVISQVGSAKFFEWLPVPNFDPGFHNYQVRMNYLRNGVSETIISKPTSETSLGVRFVQTDKKVTYNWTVRVVSAFNSSRAASGDSEQRNFTVYQSYTPPRTSLDVNNDGSQNGVDLFAFNKTWETEFGQPNYNDLADYLDDDYIDWNDLLLFHYRRGARLDPNYNNPLAQPMLSSPPDNAQYPIRDVLTGQVRLEWGAVPGAQVYLINIQGPRNFLLPVSAPRTFEIFPTAVSSAGNYLWSVTATAPGKGDPWIKAVAPARVSSPASALRMIKIE